MSTARRAARSETTLRERAYGAFTEHLLAQDIRPGQFVSQRELVALTGFPLGAIRELIPRLEAEGLIVTVPQRGLQVLPRRPQPDPQRLRVPPDPGARGGRGLRADGERRGDRAHGGGAPCDRRARPGAA